LAIRAIIFDWDGTLVRDESGALAMPANAVAQYARRHLHFALRDEDFERAFQAVLPDYRPGETTTSPSIHQLIAGAFTWLGWSVGTSDVESCSRLFFDAATRAMVAYDDARAVLSSLRYRGYAVGVVTNSLFPGDYFGVRVNELGLSGYVDAFVTSADVGLAKPHPGPFLRVLDLLGVDAHKAIFVGDRADTDIAGARAAGMRAVLLERRGRAREASGYLVIERLGALNDILGEGLASTD
jgi:putative hydrolase of the HAD superfamily